MKRFKMFMFCLIILISMTAANVVNAEIPPPNQSNAYKEVGIESLQYLIDWGSSINSPGNGYVNISGFTEANQNVDYIMVRLYLQRWNGSIWEDKGSWPFESNNNSYVSGTKSLQVTRGYYYRTKGVHSVSEGGTNEPGNSYSAIVYLN